MATQLIYCDLETLQTNSSNKILQRLEQGKILQGFDNNDARKTVGKRERKGTIARKKNYISPSYIKTNKSRGTRETSSTAQNL